VLSKSRTLSSQEKERMSYVYAELNKLGDMEEIKVRQRPTERDIKEGDMNTRYFQLVANQRRRKTTLHSLDGVEGTVETTEEIVKVATNYYRDLFKKELKHDINIDPDFFL
jgi:hypothetical protein